MSLAEQFKMEGMEKGVRETAIKMLKLGSEPAFIHQATNLSFDEIEALSDELVD